MDSKHRHELKTNELAEWFQHFPEFLKRNLSTIIGVCLIIAAFLSWFFIDRTKEAKEKEQMVKATQTMQEVQNEKLIALNAIRSGEGDVSTRLSAIAETLKTAAEDANEDQHEALLLIKRGIALRADLHFSDEIIEPEVIKSQTESAKQAYEKALKKAQGNETLEAMAKYGLALCAEELGDFTKAREILTEIVANENYKGTLFPQQAQFRLDIMSDSEEKFAFAPAPTEPEKPAIEVPDIEIPQEDSDETVNEEININQIENGETKTDQ